MDFLPKSYERYSAAMRVYLQNRYLKEDKKDIALKYLRRVLIFEILASPKQSTSTALSSFCDNVISAAQLELMQKDCFFESKITGNAVLNVDRRIITAILCNCCLISAKNKTALQIIIKDNGLYLIFCGDKPSGHFLRLLQYANGIRFYIKKERKNAVYLRLEKSKTEPLTHKEIWQYLYDPLSPIKAYLEM